MNHFPTKKFVEEIPSTLGITGGTGFVGQALQQAATKHGKKITLFSRHPEKTANARFFSTAAIPDVNGIQSLVHLAGEPIVGIWTKAKRRKILESRREGTRRLIEGIAEAKTRPSVLVSASAIGYYGDRGQEPLIESSSSGDGFLAEVAKIWEEEALQAQAYGVRVVLIRIGIVLGKNGGILPKIIPFFRCGLGSIVGSGNQKMSCIHVDDLARLILHCCDDEAICGPVNAVMPAPVTNYDFTKTMAAVLRRPVLLRMPAFFLRLTLGALSHLLLDSQHVIPKKALELGFQFQYPTLEDALKEALQPVAR